MNDASIKLIAKALWAIIAVLGIGVCVWILIEGEPDPVENPDFNDAPIGIGLWIGYIATGLAGAAALIFGVVAIATNIKKKLPFLVALASLAIVGFVAYMMSDGSTEPYAHIDIEGGVTESISKWSGFFLNFFYLLLGIAVVAVVATILRGFMLKFKKS